MSKLNDLRLRQLDQSLAQFKEVSSRYPPQGGWAQTIRKAIGMTQRQIGARTGMSETSIRSAERNEGKGTIQLNTLSKLADAMDCEVIYALVPRSTLQRTVERQAERIASELVSRVATSMKLEEQGTSRAEEMHSIDSVKAEIMRNLPGNFWDV